MEAIVPWLLVAAFLAVIVYLATRKKNRNGSGSGGGGLNHPPTQNED